MNSTSMLYQNAITDLHILLSLSFLPDMTTANEQRARFPDSSVNVYVTWVDPIGKDDPGV